MPIVINYESLAVAWELARLGAKMGKSAYTALLELRAESADPVTMEDVEKLERKYEESLTAEAINKKHNITPSDFGVDDE